MDACRPISWVVGRAGGAKVTGAELTVTFSPDSPMDAPDGKADVMVTVPPGAMNVGKLMESKTETSYTPRTAGVLTFNFQDNGGGGGGSGGGGGGSKGLFLKLYTYDDDAIQSIAAEDD